MQSQVLPANILLKRSYQVAFDSCLTSWATVPGQIVVSKYLKRNLLSETRTKLTIWGNRTKFLSIVLAGNFFPPLQIGPDCNFEILRRQINAVTVFPRTDFSFCDFSGTWLVLTSQFGYSIPLTRSVMLQILKNKKNSSIPLCSLLA